jgi:glyoxylase-like metal-dependent hydrolase (beta-lactamase superfamily II)/rhodanese-related sulfurtransferase
VLGSKVVLFKQFVDDDLGCGSYLVGDESAGEAVVVDPAYAIEQYLKAAEENGVRIVRVLETHNHADHVSGHGRLALEHGIPVAIHPAAEPEFPFEPLEDGDVVQVGEVSLRVVHTPGHRPEHCAFEVVDRTRAGEPWLVLTGDSLFVGDAARPDLAVAAVEGAQGLFHSLQRLLELPDGVEVYPGHVAGSLCGAGMSSKPSTTIGFERKFNAALGHADEQEFVDATAHSSSPRPPTIDHVVALNRGPFVGKGEPIGLLADAGGATVLDVRSPSEFAAGHVEAAFNVPVSASGFGTKAGFVLEVEEPVVIHACSPEQAQEAAAKLRAVGLFVLRGYLDHPPTPARAEPVDLDELERLVAEDSVEVLDVRELSERDEGYIPGSRNVPYRLVRSAATEIGNGRPVITICSSGQRASVAASVLLAAGVAARPVLGGGVDDWQKRGHATTAFRRCGSSG